MSVCKASPNQLGALREIGARLIGDPSEIVDNEVAVRAISGAALRFYALDGGNLNPSLDALREVLAREQRGRTWVLRTV